VRVVFFGSYDSQRHERVTVLFQGLKARGHEVLECNVPLRVSGDMRVRMLRWPLLVPLLVVRVLVCWSRLIPPARRLKDPDVVLVGYLGQFDVFLARWLWPSTMIVLDHLVPAVGVASDHGITKRWLLGLLSRVDRVATSAASIILVDTEEHLGLLPSGKASAAVVVPVGASVAYHRQPALIGESPLRVIYVGTYIPLHGTTVIARAIALIDRRVEVRFTMVGHGPDRARVEQIVGQDERVTWIDWLPAEDLAGALAQHHICLGIFGTTEKAAQVVPTKVYLGAASGCAVITGDSPPQARLLGSTAFLVPRGDPGALADLLTELAERPDRVAAARRESARLAQRFTPFETVLPLHRHLLEMQGQRSASRAPG
jgi:glycosyltransferase involved in cell wall biosynthesis